MLDPEALQIAAAQVAALVEEAKAIADASSKRHPIAAQAILPLLAAAYLRALDARQPSAPVDGVEEVVEEVATKAKGKTKR